MLWTTLLILSPILGSLAVGALAERVGFASATLRPVGVVEHVFTHRALRLHVFAGDAEGGRVRRDGYDAHRWVGADGFGGLPHGAVTGKALDLLRARGSCSS